MKEDSELKVENLSVQFSTGSGTVYAVRDVSFSVKKGETLAIVGESGSGKSVSAKAILGIEAPNAKITGGKIIYDGENLLEYTEKDFNRIRGNKITMIFQDPMSSLDPIVKIGPQMTEATLLNGKTNQKLASRELKKTLADARKILSAKDFSSLKKILSRTEKFYTAFYKSLSAKDIYDKDAVSAAKTAPDFFERARKQTAPDFKFSDSNKNLLSEIITLIQKKTFKITKQTAYEKAIRIMEETGISEPEKRFNQYPFEFSGGMRQRIVIAIAIAANPDLLICDEPTTALDVTIQAQILELINRLKKQRNMSVIFITHDLGVVANVADRIAVMYAGKIVETGTASDIFYSPAHPYTWALLSSMPDLDTKDTLDAIPGTPPDMHNPPRGDAFAPRNKYAMQIDFEEEPPMFRISETHFAATWLLHPDAPHVDIPENITERIERMKKRRAEDVSEHQNHLSGAENAAEGQKHFTGAGTTEGTK